MLPLEQLTMGQLLARSAQRWPDRPALWHAGQYYSYAWLQQQVDRCAAAFAAQGVQKGEHVGIWAEISPRVLCAFYALQQMGAVAVMLNTGLKPQELRQQMALADVSRLCVGGNYKDGPDLLAVYPEAADGLPSGRVIALGECSTAQIPTLADLCENVTAADETAAACMAARTTPQDTAVILFTSGSTSAPKAVCSSHFSRVNSGIQQAADLRCTSEDRFCVAMPMFHCFCISVNLMAAVACGGCLCIPPDRHTASILDTIETCGCTVLSAVPAMYYALIGKQQLTRQRVASLRIGIIGGASYPLQRFVQIEEALGITLLSSLGQTESTAGLTVCSPDDPLALRSTTVGRFMNHVQGRICDVCTGAPLPPGQRGEICVRGYLTMQGYYRQPELTAQVLTADGWLRTGDLGIMDENGYITLAGRVKELVIRGGENISPGEIETVLLAMPGVRDCKVVGVPDDHYGEELCACVQPARGCALTGDAVRGYLAERLAHYKVPRYLRFWAELPRTGTGKVSGNLCRSQAMKELKLCE